MTTWKRRLPLLLALLLLAPLACQEAKPPGGVPTSTEAGPAQDPVAELPDPNIRFGMPAPAAADPASREAYLISRMQYVLSYNDKTHNPNWVAWRLTQENIGKAKRGAFQPDPLLPRGFGHVTAHTYDGSGFDRGVEEGLRGRPRNYMTRMRFIAQPACLGPVRLASDKRDPHALDELVA